MATEAFQRGYNDALHGRKRDPQAPLNTFAFSDYTAGYLARKEEERDVEQTRRIHVEYLQARLAKLVEAQGWTTHHTYDRYWKKDVAALKRDIKKLSR